MSAERIAAERGLTLAATGIPVFPCLNTKAPACPNGFKAASNDRQAIGELWRQYPGPLIGTPTGVMFDVLDIDAKHIEAREWWAADRSRLPETRTHRTRSGGLHLLFKPDPQRRCSAGKIALGIDVRARGGYIVWWPAIGLPVPCEGPLAVWPDWLAPPLPQRRTTDCSVPACNGLSRYAEAALDNACRAIIGAPAGCQETTLVSESFSIGTLAGAGGIPAYFARDALRWAASRMPSYDPQRPWRSDELINKVDRAFDAGTSRPREARHG
jgi:hypothetical protein